MKKSDQAIVYHSISEVDHQTVLNTYNTNGMHRKFRISEQIIHPFVLASLLLPRLSLIPSKGLSSSVTEESNISATAFFTL